MLRLLAVRVEYSERAAAVTDQLLRLQASHPDPALGAELGAATKQDGCHLAEKPLFLRIKKKKPSPQQYLARARDMRLDLNSILCVPRSFQRQSIPPSRRASGAADTAAFMLRYVDRGEYAAW